MIFQMWLEVLEEGRICAARCGKGHEGKWQTPCPGYFGEVVDTSEGAYLAYLEEIGGIRLHFLPGYTRKDNGIWAVTRRAARAYRNRGQFPTNAVKKGVAYARRRLSKGIGALAYEEIITAREQLRKASDQGLPPPAGRTSDRRLPRPEPAPPPVEGLCPECNETSVWGGEIPD